MDNCVSLPAKTKVITTLKQYLSEKKTVVVLKTLVIERVWKPGLVHSCVTMFDITHVINAPGSLPP